MVKKMEMDIQGQKVMATILDFKTLNEEWNVYDLEDGTKVKIKTIATKIIRVEGAYNKDGDPVYQVQSTNVVTTDVPQKLKLKPTRKDIN